MCHTNFNSHDELFVHSCKEIKVETNDLEIEEKIKQEDFVPKDMSETDSDYSPKKKKRKKSVQNKQIKKDKDSEKSINSDSKKKVGRQIKKKVENGINTSFFSFFVRQKLSEMENFKFQFYVAY